jgi:hypothetical protein
VVVAGAELAKKVPRAHVVCAFNTVPSEVLFGVFQARDKTPRPSLVYCGDDEGAKDVAAKLIQDAGFDAVNAGALRIARYTEPFALLVGELAYGGDGEPELASNRRSALRSEPRRLPGRPFGPRSCVSSDNQGHPRFIVDSDVKLAVHRSQNCAAEQVRCRLAVVQDYRLTMRFWLLGTVKRFTQEGLFLNLDEFPSMSTG